MATSNNNEITVKIKCSFEELEMMLKRQCFKELNKYSTTDIFNTKWNRHKKRNKQGNFEKSNFIKGI